MEQKISIQELFLNEFIKEIALNTKLTPSPEEAIQFEGQKIIEIPSFPEQQLEIQIPPFPELQAQIQIPPFPQPMQPIMIPLQIPQMPLQPIPYPRAQQMSLITPQIPIIRPSPGNPDLGKLNFIIADPRVEEIECTGPGKNLLVVKGYSTQKTNIILTEEEIRNIIDIFSFGSRIPLIKGTLKAALGNLVVTAVTSEFVGSRFIIQKKRSI